MISLAIEEAKRQGKPVGICGQGPSDFPEFAQWLVQEGIDSISLNPDTILETWITVAREEQAMNARNSETCS